MNRRRLLVLAAGTSLSGCGFQPVYMPTASGKAGVAQRELAAIQVNLIPDRPGQVLRQALQARLEMERTAARRIIMTCRWGSAVSRRGHCHSAGQQPRPAFA